MAVRGAKPQITWGASFANTLNVPIPAGDALNYPLPADGSEWIVGPSGEADAWIVGPDQVLEVTIRWIPITDTTTPDVATGWDGTTGWRAFLNWAREMNVFRWIPDATIPGTYYPMYLVEPLQDVGVELETSKRHRKLTLKMRTSDRSVITGY